jgi:hypothetical protein
VYHCLSALFAVVIGLQNAGRCADVETAPDQDFGGTVKENFAKWDKNHDSVLSAAEIKKAFSNPNCKEQEAAAITVLQRLETTHFSHKEPFESFTLEQLNEMGTKGSEKYKKTKKSFQNILKKIDEASPELYAHGLPQIDEIRQEGTIDCWFLSVVGAMAHQRPQELASLIESNDDGSFTVHFHGCQPVKVGRPSPGEQAAWNSNGGNGLWLQVLQKAYGKILLKNDSAKHDVDPIEGVVAHFGNQQQALKLITGHEVKSKQMKDWSKSKDLRPNLIDAFAKHRLVLVGVPGHVMAGYGYDSKSDEFQIWNPWGSSGYFKPLDATMTNGVCSLPISKVFDKCTGIDIEDPSRQ